MSVSVPLDVLSNDALQCVLSSLEAWRFDNTEYGNADFTLGVTDQQKQMNAMIARFQNINDTVKMLQQELKKRNNDMPKRPRGTPASVSPSMVRSQPKKPGNHQHS